MRDGVNTAPLIDIDVAQLQAEHRRRTLGQRSRMLAAIAVLGILIAIVVGQLVTPTAVPSAVPFAESPGMPTVAAAPAATPTSAPAVRATAIVVPPVNPQPDLIVDDGFGGFVGVRTPLARAPTARFMQSHDGRIWKESHTWQLRGDSASRGLNDLVRPTSPSSNEATAHLKTKRDWRPRSPVPPTSPPGPLLTWQWTSNQHAGCSSSQGSPTLRPAAPACWPGQIYRC